jgi:hypothetical protein
MVKNVKNSEQYFVTKAGVLIGIFGNGAFPDGEFIEVPTLPENAADTWDGAAWVPANIPPVLTPKQFRFLLAYTGFQEVWDGLELVLKDTNRTAYAGLVAERASASFRLAETLALVNGFADQVAQIAPDVDLSEQTIRDAWAVAANHKGLSA